jgi:biopolymer transport protein ExbD
MAELQTGDARRSSRAGVWKAVKRSTRVDLTPMVDLGFLLITFFIFTTSMSEPHAMKLRMPHDALSKQDSMQTPESGVVTVLLAGNNRIFLYYGSWLPGGSGVMETDYNAVRNLLNEKKKITRAEDLMVLIKSSPSATYRNCVDMLDEMLIGDIKRYAFVESDQKELEWMEGKASR